MSDYEDQESDETEEPTGFAALPKETQAELKKLRKESESLRTRLKERDHEILTARYGEDIVSMIPEEVTTYERRAELAEIYKAKLAPASSNPEQTEPAPAEVATEPEPAGLKAVVNAPAPGTQVPGELMSRQDYRKLLESDPISAARVLAERKVELEGQPSADGKGWEARW